MKAGLLALAVVVALAGCDQQGSGAVPVERTSAKEMADLKAEVAQLKASAKEQDDQLKSMYGDVFVLKAVADSKNKTVFDPITDQGYGVIDVGLGRVAVSVEDVSAYANGVRVVLRIGNPNAVSFAGLSGKVIYGPSSAPKPNGEASAWYSKQQTTSIDFPTSIAPGRWTRVTVTLPGIQVNDLGRLEVSLQSNQIELYKPVGG